MFKRLWWRPAATMLAFTGFAAGSFLFPGSATVGQEYDAQAFDQLVTAGEFPAAMAMANQQPEGSVRDQMLVDIARSQRLGDTGHQSFITLGQVRDDVTRASAYDQLTSFNGFAGGSGSDGFASGGESGGQGLSGGITQADFTELVDLLQETIDPDSWELNGGNGRLRPFPSGVWVDSSGTLQRVAADKSGRLAKLRAQLNQRKVDPKFDRTTELRKISLSRLERQLQVQAATGQPVSQDLKYLAGIYELKYVMLYPESGDVVIAGPAGPWEFDSTGRAVNTETGRPVLNLDDLVVCLRNARQNHGQFTCSIDPRAANLADARSFLATTKLKGRTFRDEVQKILGQMDVTVDGIDPSSHTARVIVEADYRMKLIGLGVEPSVPGLASYFDRIRLQQDGQLPKMDQLVRWWFTMNYDSIQTDEDRMIFELNGQGVKLLSESEFWNQAGQREHRGVSSPAAAGYAQDFTTRFLEIADQDPVFGQLKNVFDCAIAASLIHQEGLNRKVQWNLSFLTGTSKPGLLSYQLASEQVPVQVDSILGQKILKHGRLTHTVSAFGGGVTFEALQYTARDKISVQDGKELVSARKSSAPTTSNKLDWSWD